MPLACVGITFLYCKTEILAMIIFVAGMRKRPDYLFVILYDKSLAISLAISSSGCLVYGYQN